MEQYADLEITLSDWDDQKFHVRFHFDRGDNPAQSGSVSAWSSIDLEKLKLTSTDKEFGLILQQSLFCRQEIKDYYKSKRSICDAADLKLRLRLAFDNVDPSFFNLCWEKLLKPETDAFLALDSNLPFSRFIFSSNDRKVNLRPKGNLKALVMVAAPSDMDAWGFHPSNPQEEVDRAVQALQGIAQKDQVDVLAAPPVGARFASFENLKLALQKGYDILHLVCHGRLDWGDPEDLSKGKKAYIWLEAQDGTARRVDGDDLLRVLKEEIDVDVLPRLIVMVSCQSGGSGQTVDEGGIASLGPRLAALGIPAVVAMQTNVSMVTMDKFLPPFYAKLDMTGRVDQAVADGRAAVFDSKQDWWAPVLYLRLRNGLLWYESGVADSAKTFGFWEGIKSRIKPGNCTPILGSELLNSIIGPQDQIAHAWARDHQYPMVASDQDNFPLVTQYLSSYGGIVMPGYPMEWIRNYLANKFGTRLSTGLSTRLANTAGMNLAEQARLTNDLISEAGRLDRQDHPDNPFTILADLPVTIYLTTSPDTLLEDTLSEHKPNPKNPVSLDLCWKRNALNNSMISLYKQIIDTNTSPSIDCPWVFHLFGSYQNPDLLVLTEDDLFDYLMVVNSTSINPRVPTPIQTALLSNALLFLGFHMKDWSFRLLFRSILNEKRLNERLSTNKHKLTRSLTVQFRPGEDYIDPNRAMQVLDKMLTRQNFDLYWGRSIDFLRDLRAELKK